MREWLSTSPFPFIPIPVWLMNNIYHWIISNDDTCSKCKHLAVLASKSQLRNSMWESHIFSYRWITKIQNVQNTKAELIILFNILLDYIRVKWWEFWHMWKSSRSHSHFWYACVPLQWYSRGNPMGNGNPISVHISNAAHAFELKCQSIQCYIRRLMRSSQAQSSTSDISRPHSTTDTRS